MWMSSSSSWNSKLPWSSSPPTRSRPAAICSSSASSRTPSLARARACAFDCSTSNDARRQSNEMEELIRRKSGSWSSPKRDMGLSLGSLAERLGERRADPIDLALGHRGEERQRQRALGDPLRNRELPAHEPEPFSVRRQKVNAGQIRLGGDPLIPEGGDHPVAVDPLRQLHNEDEPAAPLVAVVLAWQNDVVIDLLPGGGGTELGEPLPVERRDIVPGVEQLIQALDLCDADRGLQVGEPVVEPHAVVLDLAVVRGSALVALARDAFRDLLVRRDQDAALSRGHLLVRVEGEDRDVAGGPDLLPVAIDGSEGLRGVLEDPNTRTAGDFPERRKVGRVAEDVDREDPGRLVGHGGFDRFGVDVKRHRVDVAEHRRRTLIEDRIGGRDEAQRARDDLVTLPPSHRSNPEVKGGSPARYGHGVAATQPL